MNALRIRRKLESETLHLPELKPLIGKNVEIIVLDETAPAIVPGSGDWDSAMKAVAELKGHDIDAFRADADCFLDAAPAKPPSAKEKKALRALLTAEQLEALVDIAEAGGPDMHAIARIRAASMT